MRTDRALYGIFCEKDSLRRIIVPVEGQGGVTLSYLCPHCHRLPLEDNIASTIGRPRTESWSYKTARTAEKQKCFQQKDGDSPVNMVIQGLPGKPRPVVKPKFTTDFPEGSGSGKERMS